MRSRVLWGSIAVVVVVGLVAAGYSWGKRTGSEATTDRREAPVSNGAGASQVRQAQEAVARRIRELAARQQAESAAAPAEPSDNQGVPADPTPLSPAEARDR